MQFSGLAFATDSVGFSSTHSTGIPGNGLKMTRDEIAVREIMEEATQEI